jgi:hypothetical protein
MELEVSREAAEVAQLVEHWASFSTTNVILYQGNAWSSSQSAFVAPRAGIYYFGTSYGVASLTNASVALYRNNGGSYHCLMAYSLSNHEGATPFGYFVNLVLHIQSTVVCLTCVVQCEISQLIVHKVNEAKGEGALAFNLIVPFFLAFPTPYYVNNCCRRGHHQ